MAKHLKLAILIIITFLIEGCAYLTGIDRLDATDPKLQIETGTEVKVYFKDYSALSMSIRAVTEKNITGYVGSQKWVIDRADIRSLVIHTDFTHA